MVSPNYGSKKSIDLATELAIEYANALELLKDSEFRDLLRLLFMSDSERTSQIDKFTPIAIAAILVEETHILERLLNITSRRTEWNTVNEFIKEIDQKNGYSKNKNINPVDFAGYWATRNDDDFATLNRDQPARLARTLITESRHVIIIIESNKPIGIITISDLFKINDKDISQKIGDIMSKQLVKVNAKDRMEDVREILDSKNFNQVPVVDQDGTLEGVVTKYEVARWFAGEK